jgi:hypothetical protein
MGHGPQAERKVVTVEDTEEYSAKWWCTKIAEAEKSLDEKWRDSADKVVNRYLDRRDDGLSENLTHKYNIFWANTQILKSAMYATKPSPRVTRQYGDAKDDVARTAALILERMLKFGLNDDASDMHNAFQAAVEDRLIPGLGQVWLRYDVEVEDYTVPAVLSPLDPMQVLVPEQQASRIVEEEVETEYVPWRDFIFERVRTWDEVTWVAKRSWMAKAAFKKRFGDDKYKELREASTSGSDYHTSQMPRGFRKGRVEVFEVWCKDSKKVYWLSKALEEFLDEKDDPLQLDDFFPCPRPLLATHTTNDFLPRPDYVLAQDQYEELDTLNQRIYLLTKAMRVVGAYDATMPELGKMITGSESNMIPVDQWAVFAEKGGSKGAVDWFPIDQVATVLEKLIALRQSVIGQIYELTSISDIMRGATNPRETAKAQSLKAQYSSVRLQLAQQAVGQFVRHAMRIKSEIIARHFQPETIAKQSQIMFTESAQFAQPAIELLKDYEASQYRVEVSEESLSITDYTAEQELRQSYLIAVGQFLSQAAPIVQGMPGAMPYLLRILQWTTASFKGSNDIEAVLDEAIAAATQAPPQQQDQKPPPPDPQIAERAKAVGQIAIDNNQHRNDLQRIRAEGIKDILTQEPKNANV